MSYFKHIFVLLLSALPILSHADIVDLGVVGKTYEIQEEDMLVAIKNELKELEKNGKLAEINDQRRKSVEKYIQSPPTVEGLVNAKTNKSHYFDPSIEVPYDIKDANGNVFYRAGTKVNPLHFKNITKKLIFFRGDDPKQVAWAKQQYEKNIYTSKPILVSGNPMKLMKEWDTWIYFDQRGQLTSKFLIQEVPAIVYQEGEFMRIDVVAVNE